MSMTFIASHTVTSSTEATVVFSSIPGTHTDLVAFISARTPRAAANDAVRLTVNSGVAPVAKRTYANVGAGNTVDTGAEPLINGNTSTANAYSNAELYIGDYAGEDHKPYIVNGTVENNATQAFVYWMGGSFPTGSAITSITFDADVSAYFSVGSKFYLYAITAGPDSGGNVTVTGS